MNYTELFSTLMIIIGILVALVNIITEVAKKIHNFKKAESVNIFVTVVSVVLTVATFLAYWQYKQMLITWYVFFAFIIVGVMVAFAAMLGFDKLLKNFDFEKIIELFKKVE